MYIYTYTYTYTYIYIYIYIIYMYIYIWQHFYPPRERPGLGNQFTYAGVLRRYFFLLEGSCPAIELAVA